MSKNLVIVESPAKAKTIENYLGKDFTVKSSFGHVRDLPAHDMGVDVANGFNPLYEISEDKVKVINELRSIAKSADEVWLATDDDREGEAISWHLKEALGLPDSTKRIVFREITKSALQNAIEKPRQIDLDLVNAQQARRVLDRLVGYELSPILWKKIRIGKSSLSAGRVQSVAVRLIVEREREVDSFQSKSSFKVIADFDLGNGKVLSAELPKNFATKQEASAFLQKCASAQFVIKNLETKPGKKSPAPPFTTSTLQQEASRKLGFSVAQTMTVAQRLYEAGKISYMRTDSTNLSKEALTKAENQIVSEYGAEYHKVRVYKTKSDSAQEAHEAIRPTEFSVQVGSKDRNEQRLYDLIWKRAIASQMADAILERTVATIQISTASEELVAQGEVIKFEGFLKVYLESSDDDEQDEEQKGMLPPLTIGQSLALGQMKASERFTRHAPRYTEASLVKQLEEMGIGRPSTYAPTISTIIKREYVVKEDRPGQERTFEELLLKAGKITEKTKTETYGAEKSKLFPTNAGIIVNDFLVNYFEDVVDYSFTANVEKDFDNIAEGKIAWQDMIGNFYKSFHQKVTEVAEEKFDKSLTTRELGNDPATGKVVSVRIGKYGPYVQIGEAEDEEKPRYAKLQKGQLMETLTLDDALELFKLPREVGFYEDKSMIVSIGKFGPYIKFDDKYFNLLPSDDPYTIDEARAIAIIEEKRKAESSDTLGEYNGEPISKGKGRFGPYVKHDGKYYSLGKGLDLATISLEQAIELIKQKEEAEANKVIKEFAENDKVKVLNGRYGPYIAFGKRNIKIPKDTEPAELTYEEVMKLAEGVEEKPKAKKKVTRKAK